MPYSFKDGKIGEIFSLLNSRKSIQIIKYATIFAKFHLLNESDNIYIAPILELFDFMRKIINNEMNLVTFDDLEKELYEIMSKNEGVYPYSECTFIFHEFIHIIYFMKKLGPLRDWWMFPTERMNKFIKNINKVNNNPHFNIARNYQVF